MLRRGLKGAIICGRKIMSGEAASARLTTADQRVVFQQADLANLDDCRAITDRAISEFGTFDILVNSAGITDRGGTLDGDAALWERTFAINARAPFFLMQNAALHWREKGRPGTIVNVATVTAHGGVPMLTVYAASKAALVTTTRNVAYSLARDGIGSMRWRSAGWTRRQKTSHRKHSTTCRTAGRPRSVTNCLPAGR
jgi:NAD(P)-dependent dehydrogenase (short-subunit alcohol dehydrogenase family)